MGGAFKIGRFSGIDVRLHWTFLLLLAFFAFIGYQASGSAVGALTATVAIVALFFCVLLHEFGHSLAAQRLGIEIHSITLLPLGGVSNLEFLPEKPADEVKITVAGPLMNVVLAPIFWSISQGIRFLFLLLVALTTNRYLNWKETLMQDQTEDQPVLKHIQRLMAEEQQLHEQERLAAADRERLAKINVELDQCWDLLRQRRALRDAGKDPDQAEVRPADVVERYLQ
jgi:uncharacterized protein DUF2630/peptidase M50-like protein